MPETEADSGNGCEELKKKVIENPLLEDNVNVSDDEEMGICKSCSKMFTEVAKKVKSGFSTAACTEVKRFRRRLQSEKRQSLPNICFVCVRSAERDSSSVHGKAGIDSALTRCWKDSVLRDTFTAAFSERSGLSTDAVRELMRSANDTAVVCNVHKQLVRRTIDAVKVSLCNRTCAIPHCDVSHGVRAFRVNETDDMATLEMEDACHIIFDGVSLSQLRDKRICAGHRSALNRSSDSSTLPSLQFPPFARVLKSVVAKTSGFDNQAPRIVYISEVLEYLAQEVSAFLDASCDAYSTAERTQNHIASTTSFMNYSQQWRRHKLQAILVPRLALRGIYLDHSPSSQRKFYINPDATVHYAKMIPKAPAGRQGSQNTVLLSLTASELSRQVSLFGEGLKRDLKSFSTGDWSLRRILSLIPSHLWTFMMWALSSQRRKEAWLIRAREQGISAADIYVNLWPVSNIPSVLESHGSNLFSSLAPADVVLIRRVLTILEQMAFTKTSAVGPILLATGIGLYVSETRKLHETMNKLGLACSRGLVLALQKELVAARQEQEQSGGVYSSIPSGYWCFLALDNLDKAMPHALNVRGANTSGLHVTFGSLHAIELPGNSLQRSADSHFPLRHPLQQFPTREELVDDFVPSTEDADLVSFQNIVFGLVLTYRDRLASDNSSQQLSLRRLLLSALTSHKPRGSKVILARLDDYKATNKHELLKTVDKAVEQLSSTNKDAPLLGVVGDCPTYVILWTRWSSLVKSGEMPRWFPVPGGAAFHDWKSGSFPALKFLFKGSIYEDIIAEGRSGMSQFYVDNFSTVTNLRKNRRTIEQVFVAQIRTASDSMRISDPVFSDALESLESSTHPSLDLSARGLLQEMGSGILVDELVTQRVYKMGEAFRKSILLQSQKSTTADFYLRVLLCEHVVPIIAAQALLRVGQTSVYSKFWFALSPDIMSTQQSTYQKLVVMQMSVHAALPVEVLSDLLAGEPGCLVICRHGDSDIAQYPHDECLECGVKIVKQSIEKGVGDPLKCIYWIGEFNAIDKKMRSEMRMKEREAEGDFEKDDLGIIRGYDREARGASNSLAYDSFMRDRAFHSVAHLSSDGIQNWLRDPHMVIQPGKAVDALRSIRESGKRKMEILVSRLLPPYYRFPMPPSDIAALGLKKPLGPGKWTRAGVVKSMFAISQAQESQASRGKRKYEDPEREFLAHSKRLSKRTRLLQDIALNPDISSDVSTAAKESLSRVRKVSSIVSPRSSAYGEGVGSGDGRRRIARPAVKSGFLRRLQSVAISKLGNDGTFMNESGRISGDYLEAHVDIENVVHGNLAASSAATLCGDILREKTWNSVRQVSAGNRGWELRYLHLHSDVEEWTVRTKDDTAERRSLNRVESSRPNVGAAFDEVVESVAVARFEKAVYTSACLIYGAMEAIQDRLNQRNHGETDTVAVEPAKLSCFCHGGSFAVETSAFGCLPQDLLVVRTPPGTPGLVLVCRKQEKSQQTPVDKLDSLRAKDSVLDSDCMTSHEFASFWGDEVTVLPREACLGLSEKEGLHVFSSGWSRHGEGETRIVWSHLQISCPLMNSPPSEPVDPSGFCTIGGGNIAGSTVLPGKRSGCVILSTDSDCPMISLSNADKIASHGFQHVIGSQVIDIDSLLRVLDLLSVQPRAIVYAFAMGGCDFVPSPYYIPHFSFVDVMLFTSLGRKAKTAIECVSVSSTDVTDVKAKLKNAHIALTILAYAKTRLGKHFARVEALSGILEPGSDAFLSWAEQVRQDIREADTVGSESLMCPCNEDIDLQGRRCLWVSALYWTGARNCKWGWADLGEKKLGLNTVSRCLLKLVDALLSMRPTSMPLYVKKV